MKFKLFNIVWDFSIIIFLLYSSLGLLLILLSFHIDKLGYYNIPYFIVAFIYIATEDHIYNKFIKSL